VPNERLLGTRPPQVFSPSCVVDSTSGLGAECFHILERKAELLSDLFEVELLVQVKGENDSM